MSMLYSFVFFLFIIFIVSLGLRGKEINTPFYSYRNSYFTTLVRSRVTITQATAVRRLECDGALIQCEVNALFNFK